MKKVFVAFVCASLFVSHFCVGENAQDEKKTEEKEKQIKPASDESALAEKIITGILFGAMIGWVARKCNCSWGKSGIVGTAGGGTGFVLDAKYGFLPNKTRTALMSLGFQILQGKVSDPQLLDKVRDLSQECAIAFIKELLAQYGTGGAPKALGKLKDEVKKGQGYFKAVKDAPLPKRGKIFSAKINFDELKDREEKIAAVIDKIEQAEKIVHFRFRFDAANKHIHNHVFHGDSSVVRRKFNLKQQEEKTLQAEELEKIRVELAKEKNNLPFKCVQQEELDNFFETSDTLLEKLKEEKKLKDEFDEKLKDILKK